MHLVGYLYADYHYTRSFEYKAHPKAGNNLKTTNGCKWDPIKLMFLYCMHQHFMLFVNSGLMMAV
jgi:hypothetical protein